MARPREGLCSKRVLVMDRLHGTRMLDVMRTAREGRGHLPCPPEVVRVHGGWSGLVRSLHLAWGEMVLEEGVFHTDPHPGNLLLLDDGRLGILDWVGAAVNSVMYSTPLDQNTPPTHIHTRIHTGNLLLLDHGRLVILNWVQWALL